MLSNLGLRPDQNHRAVLTASAQEESISSSLGVSNVDARRLFLGTTRSTRFRYSLGPVDEAQAIDIDNPARMLNEMQAARGESSPLLVENLAPDPFLSPDVAGDVEVYPSQGATRALLYCPYLTSDNPVSYTHLTLPTICSV